MTRCYALAPLSRAGRAYCNALADVIEAQMGYDRARAAWLAAQDRSMRMQRLTSASDAARIAGEAEANRAATAAAETLADATARLQRARRGVTQDEYLAIASATISAMGPPAAANEA